MPRRPTNRRHLKSVSVKRPVRFPVSTRARVKTPVDALIQAQFERARREIFKLRNNRPP